MKRTLLPFIAAILALTLIAAGIAWAERRPQAYTPHGPGDLYLALGDSLAWGFGLDDAGAESYPALLGAGLVARAPIDLVNLAAPGETTGSFVDRQLPQAIGLIRQARGQGRRVSPITLDIGGNDLRGVERAAPAERAATVEQARRNLARILDELRAAAGPTADIAVMTYYNPYGGNPSVEDGDAFWVERLNAAIREEAELHGVAVAEVYHAFADGRFYTHTFILSGDIHANAQGHRLIAATFREALRYAE
ncbi:MAG: SGNH/GDSL hydrolase family protein [Chloroflexales bacterium]|nr:SGNH/GDSL hydrolase family protein [Chloroflexales bacterium]